MNVDWAEKFAATKITMLASPVIVTAKNITYILDCPTTYSFSSLTVGSEWLLCHSITLHPPQPAIPFLSLWGPMCLWIPSTHLLRCLPLGLFLLIANSSIFIGILFTFILITWPTHLSLVFCIFSFRLHATVPFLSALFLNSIPPRFTLNDPYKSYLTSLQPTPTPFLFCNCPCFTARRK